MTDLKRAYRRLLTITALAILQSFPATGRYAAAVDARPVGIRAIAVLFDEHVVADNVVAVRKRAAETPENERFEYLVQWVLPCHTHATIRMSGVFTQTDPAPVNLTRNERDSGGGGILVSPVFDLLDFAKTANRLGELLTMVDAIPEPSDEEQQRARVAFRMLVHMEMDQQDETARAADRLFAFVTQSSPDELSDMWPETLVVHRAVVHFGGNAAADDLLAHLFAQRSQRGNPPGLLTWHNQIASIAGRNGHVETARPDSAIVQPPDLEQWVSVSRLRSITRGLGLPQALWSRQRDRVDKMSGHDEDYLFFRSPLVGNYEMECEMSPSACQAMVAGTLIGNDSDLSHIWSGTLRDGARRIPIDHRFTGFGKWVHYRCVVQNNVATTYLNGLAVHSEQLTAPDPWIAVRSWSRSHASAHDIRITGNPVIPDHIDLSASTDLRGWYPYHDESVGTKGARWEHLLDLESTGQIFGQANAPPDSYFESLLVYQRPLEEVGSVSYQFLYTPGTVETSPALDRMAFILQPEGVRIHWITDNSWDDSGLRPDNFLTAPSHRRGPPRLPLIVNSWNELTLALHQQKASLSLNGQLIYECPLDAGNRRTFGFFHFADQTESRVRSVTMRGSWPTSLPSTAEQELADLVAIQLDADRPKLKAVFTHDFATKGFPPEYFVTDDTDQRGALTLRSDGAFVTRPGEGVWLDRNIRMPIIIHGDFDIEVAFDQLKMQSSKDACIMLGVQLDDEQQHQCRMLRIRTEAKLQQLQASLSVVHSEGGRSFAAQDPTACEATSGRLRLARRGSTLHYLFAENDSNLFRLIGSESISDRPSVPDGLTLHTLCHGSGETQVLWKSLTLRADRLMIKPRPGDRPPINLYLMNADGTQLRLLTAPPKGFSQIASVEWSSDGSKFVGDMSAGGVDTSRIVIMNSDGSGFQDLGPGCMPSLSPDNSEIVFSQPAVGIMKMKADGTDRKVLESNGWGTQWSPNGRYIAWASGNNIVLLDTKSGIRRNMLTAEQTGQVGYVYWNMGWSLNSTSLAFKARSADSSKTFLAVADADASNGFGIVYSGTDYINEDFTWHPDGRRVVCSLFDQARGASGLTMMNRDAPENPEPIEGQPANWNVLGGDWSPDGRQIALSAHELPQPVDLPRVD